MLFGFRKNVQIFFFFVFFLLSQEPLVRNKAGLNLYMIQFNSTSSSRGQTTDDSDDDDIVKISQKTIKEAKSQSVIHTTISPKSFSNTSSPQSPTRIVKHSIISSKKLDFYSDESYSYSYSYSYDDQETSNLTPTSKSIVTNQDQPISVNQTNNIEENVDTQPIQTPTDKISSVNNENDPKIEIHENQIDLSTNDVKDSQSTPTESPIPTSSEYLVSRSSQISIKGKTLYFSISCQNDVLFSAVLKHPKSNHISIFEGDILNSQETKGVHKNHHIHSTLLIGNNKSDFSLRKTESDSDEILVIRFIHSFSRNTTTKSSDSSRKRLPSSSKIDFIEPSKETTEKSDDFLKAEILKEYRQIIVNFFTPKKGTPPKLVSKPPRITHEGKVIHDFNGQFAYESIKNAALATSIHGPIVLCIKKVGADTLKIEPEFAHEALWIFAIGIASFVTKVR